LAKKYLASVHEVIWEHMVRPSHLDVGAGDGAGCGEVPGWVDSLDAASFFRRSAFSSSTVGGFRSSCDGHGVCWYWTEPLVSHLYIAVAAHADEESSSETSAVHADVGIEAMGCPVKSERNASIVLGLPQRK
jgi:hypothetical protein